MGSFLPIFLATFVLEDVALAMGVTSFALHKISFIPAFLACFVGIVLGDIALYLVGYWASSFLVADTSTFMGKFVARQHSQKPTQIVSLSLILSRFLPGTRLPIYVGAGLMHFSFRRFVFWITVGAFGWVALAFAGGQLIFAVLSDHWIIAFVGFPLLFQFLRGILPELGHHWPRRALLYSWRKWLHFEFWPAWLFYLPMIPIYMFLSFRHRSLFAPFYANPRIRHGGLIGESKWDFLAHLNREHFATLKAVKFDRGDSTIAEKLQEYGLKFPMFVKPDVGQRGFAVREIKNEIDLSRYLSQAQFDLILQEKSQFSNEAGLFYIRQPGQSSGSLFSITDKIFPAVIGDGQSKIGELILKDPRARIMASVYFTRHAESLDRVLESHEVFQLTECGNHCQGAIFVNGAELLTADLTKAIDQIAGDLPDFYFGRFDVRYKNRERLMAGQDFQIVEINGAGSEATHIWDHRTKLLVAYQVLFKQWELLFAIGAQVRRTSGVDVKLQLGDFLKEVLRVWFRRHKLSISS